jgi:hypothetical protein
MTSGRGRSSTMLFAVWAVGTTVAVAFSIFAVNLAGAGVSDQVSVALTRGNVAAVLGSPTSLVAPTPTDREAARRGAAATTETGIGHEPPPGARVASSDPAGSSSPGEGESPTSTNRSGSTTTSALVRASTTTTTPSSTKSVSSQGGTAVFQCIGSTLSLVSTAARANYEADKKTATEVVFVRDLPAHTSQITASCSAGVITAKVKEIADN